MNNGEKPILLMVVGSFRFPNNIDSRRTPTGHLMKLTSKYAHLLKGTEISLPHGTMLLFCSIKADFGLIHLSWGVRSSSGGAEVTDSVQQAGLCSPRSCKVLCVEKGLKVG